MFVSLVHPAFVVLTPQPIKSRCWPLQRVSSVKFVGKHTRGQGRSLHAREAVSAQLQPAIHHRISLPAAVLLVVPEGPPMLPLAASRPRALPTDGPDASLAEGLVRREAPLSAESPADLAEGLVREADRGALSARDLSAGLSAIAAAEAREPALRALPLLAERLIGRASDLDGRGVARSLWAAAVLREEAPVLHTVLPSLAERLVRTAPRMGMHDAGTAFCALAALRAQFAATSLLVGPMADLLVDRFMEEEGAVEPWLVANMFWSLTVMHLDEERLSALVHSLVEETKRRVDDLDAQAVSLIIWAIATLQRRAAEGGTAAYYETSELLPALVRCLHGTAKDMTSYELLTVVWALGALRGGARGVGALLNEIRVDLACALDSAALAELSLAIWGLAMLGHRDEEVLEVAMARAIELEATASIRLLATAFPRIIWACATLEFSHALLMRTVADRFSATGGTLRFLRRESYHALLWAYSQLDPTEQFATFCHTLRSKLLLLVKTRLNYVAISRNTPEKLKNKAKVATAVELGSFGPDARKCKR